MHFVYAKLRSTIHKICYGDAQVSRTTSFSTIIPTAVDVLQETTAHLPPRWFTKRPYVLHTFNVATSPFIPKKPLARHCKRGTSLGVNSYRYIFNWLLQSAEIFNSDTNALVRAEYTLRVLRLTCPQACLGLAGVFTKPFSATFGGLSKADSGLSFQINAKFVVDELASDYGNAGPTSQVFPLRNKGDRLCFALPLQLQLLQFIWRLQVG